MSRHQVFHAHYIDMASPNSKETKSEWTLPRQALLTETPGPDQRARSYRWQTQVCEPHVKTRANLFTTTSIMLSYEMSTLAPGVREFPLLWSQRVFAARLSYFLQELPSWEHGGPRSLSDSEPRTPPLACPYPRVSAHRSESHWHQKTPGGRFCGERGSRSWVIPRMKFLC